MRKEIRTESRNTELIAERRSQIVCAAAKLMMKNGFHRTTIRQIAHASKITVGTIYYYIGSKEDILRMMIDIPNSRLIELGDSINNSIDAMSCTALISLAIERYFRLVDELQDIWLFNFTESKNLPLDSLEIVLKSYIYFVGVLERVLSRGHQNGEFHIGDVRLTAQNIISIGLSWTHARWLLRPDYTITDFIEKQTSMILSHICARDAEYAQTSK